MEIQGLTIAQNTHHKHGVSRRTGLSPPGTATGARCLTLSNKIGVKNEPESRERESDKNNNWPKTSPFRLLAENGSGGCQSLLRQNSKGNAQQIQRRTEQSGLRNVIGSQGKDVKGQQLQQDCLETGSKSEFVSTETGMQMALPVCVVEESHTQQRQPQLLRQQHQGGATLHNSLPCESVAAGKANIYSAANINRKDNEEFYVVFNIVQEADSNGSNKEMGRSVLLSKDGRRLIGKDADSTSKTKPDISMEVQTTSVLIHPDEKLLALTSRNSSVRKHVGARNHGSIAQERCEATVTNSSQRFGMSFESDSNVVMANERCDNQPLDESFSANDGGTSDQTSVELHQQAAQKFTGALISENTTFTETTHMSDVNSDYLSDYSGTTVAGGSNATPSEETFSGTIMINNQSIIVTIENGVLTLAAPPDGHAPKEDVVNLKHHLGVKDHQDIVLINYDGATKTAGKNSNVAVGSIQYEESRMGVSDSGLSLEENCAFPDAGSALDSCTSTKEQEDGTLCPLGDGGVMQTGFIVCDSDLAPLKLGGTMASKKGSRTKYRCPQPECVEIFDAKHKLKIHLISHTDDQRPFKCTMEDCGWSFTTSYKLKRHLQSHDKVRPFTCEWENCGRKFTTVYNLKAHVKVHDQENAFACDICSERFRSATKLTNHQRAHFEPERPHKCEFPGCEKTFITFSALFSHNRTHFREIGQFTCTFPGCDKRYDKACRLKIHLRSHTGERPFMCDSEGCGWSFTSMSKLLRHKRKHDDDRRFTCPEEGCGKSFTRAEHLKGHSITHLGTKPFECHVEGCSAKFSARSSLYIHSKKHLQDSSGLRTRCPVASCSKHFSSRSSLKSHMLKHHNLSAAEKLCFVSDVLSQLEMSTSLTPSSELTSAGQAGGAAGGAAVELGNIDLTSLFSNVPGGGAGVTGPAAGPGAAGLTMDLSLVNSGILTIDAASVGATLGGAGGALAQAVDPLILAAGADIGPHGLDGALGTGGAGGVLPQGTLNLDDVQTVNPEALGSLAALSMRGPAAPEQLHPLSSSSALVADAPASLTPSSSLAGAPGPELLSAPPKPERAGGALLGPADVLGQQEGSKVVTQFVFSGHAGGFSAQKDPELSAVSACSFLESGGSARTDYRAIQLAKRKKQKGPACSPGGTGLGPRKSKGAKSSSATATAGPASGRFGEGVASANAGLTIRDPVTGAQYVQIQLLQDDPAGDGDLAFQLSSQTSSSHSQLTVDLPVNILQEPAPTTEDDAGSDNSQFTGSTINLQDLE
ncbi:zinc finger protein ZXDC isoform X1 [Anguilla rostrata]|uniref:zinc finger protein ZXDC isoform X1 n=1 Tax=Anguilla rostrata TaxID=7938 RepID=UPI0030CCF631